MPNAVYDFYHPLCRRKLTHSRRHYSTIWLGAAPNYSCLRGSRGPSAQALIYLFRALWERRHHLLAARVAVALLWTVPVGGRAV